ncbi:MAG: LysR family transcriptional regulator, partial [Planctomycetaceae bacterium]
MIRFASRGFNVRILSLAAAGSISPQASATDKAQHKHQPRRLLRTLLSSLDPPKLFGKRMRREAQRRRFDQAARKAFVGDGLPCNWKLQRTHFPDYVAILDFVHAVSHLFDASVACCGKTDAAWSAYQDWMTRVWRGDIAGVVDELKSHQQRLGEPPDDATADDPRERLRLEIGSFEHNQERMDYARYRREGLPTTSAWMESAVKELNYRVKGTE